MRRREWRASVVWVAAVLAVTGCAPAPPAATGGATVETPAVDGAVVPLAGTSWRLEEQNGRPPVPIPGGAAVTLMFASGEPRVSGYGGCNQFNGSYTQNGASLTFGPLASTRRACVEPRANTQEATFLRALESTTRFAVFGDVLVLYAGDEVTARFRRGGG